MQPPTAGQNSFLPPPGNSLDDAAGAMRRLFSSLLWNVGLARPRNLEPLPLSPLRVSLGPCYSCVPFFPPFLFWLCAPRFHGGRTPTALLFKAPRDPLLLFMVLRLKSLHYASPGGPDPPFPDKRPTVPVLVACSAGALACFRPLKTKDMLQPRFGISCPGISPIHLPPNSPPATSQTNRLQ